MTTRSTPHRAWQSEGSRLRSAPSGTEESSTPHANRTEARRRQHSEGGVLLALADWFLPTSVANDDPSALRRVRLTMAVGFFSGCGVSATLVVATEHPDSTTLRALTYSLAILLIAVPAIVKAGVPIRAIQHAIIALLVGYSLTLVGATGGIDSGGFFVALLTPLYAIVLLGGRAGLGWTANLEAGVSKGQRRTEHRSKTTG